MEATAKAKFQTVNGYLVLILSFMSLSCTLISLSFTQLSFMDGATGGDRGAVVL